MENDQKSVDGESSAEEGCKAFEESDSEEAAPKKSKKKARKIIMNVALTKYLVVKKAATKYFGWKLTKTECDEDWDVFWTDSAVEPDKLARMKLYQKINHFPGMYALARKNHLAKNLNRLRKSLPKDFKFFPRTWLVPAEFSDLRQYSSQKKNKVFIVKPEASCQGRGIFLTKKFDDFTLDDRYVVQEYLKRPYLIDGLKFDLRIYVLVAGCDPLKIFLHKEGLARFATEPYIQPNSSNMSKPCMHLTNYAVNKNNENFIFNEDPENDDVGHKRSLSSVFAYLEEKGHDINKLWADIKQLINKTLCSVQPSLAHTYKACQPDDPYNGMCFELLGLDVILDKKLKPWLLEVNHSPSFSTDSPLDWKIKYEVITEALTLLNVSYNNRIRVENKQKQDVLKRSTGKKNEVVKEDKLQEIAKAQQLRDKWETKHLGGYTKIFPCENMDKFNHILEVAKEIYEEWTGASKTKKENIKHELPLPKPTTDIRAHVKSANSKSVRSISMAVTKEENKKIHTKANLSGVYERLSNNQRKLKPENVSFSQPYQPLIHLDSNYTTTPSSEAVLELCIQNIQIQKPKNSSKSKDSSPKHLKLEEILKEKRSLETMKRNWMVKNRCPLTIHSFVSKTDEDVSFSSGNFFIPRSITSLGETRKPSIYLPKSEYIRRIKALGL
ncbi:ttll-11_9 [Blepharisma stoltei]|uniref:Uncharacterized protein n=1 Tax=Blepharisma stoltei TaxID=1481888 RepID=A0AAU9JPJ7_9CILI|nr:unnamed protein product [Blepharisma stoltei]